MLFSNKQKKLESLLEQYTGYVAECIERFCKTVSEYAHNGDRQMLQENSLAVHRSESSADDMRREIEVMMYSKALFPESRGDILSLLETLDRVPNQAEAVVRMLLNQYITIPADYRGGIMEMVELSHRCVNALLEAVGKLFVDFTNATVAIGKIDELESAIDNIEANLMEKIFSSDMDGTDKILLRDAVKYIASISDKAENGGDCIRIMIAKRGA